MSTNWLHEAPIASYRALQPFKQKPAKVDPMRGAGRRPPGRIATVCLLQPATSSGNSALTAARAACPDGSEAQRHRMEQLG
jgi:hypothetical protein